MTHESLVKSSVKNNSGTGAVKWKASFYGEFNSIKVDGNLVKATTKEVNGSKISYATIDVPVGGRVIAEAVKLSFNDIKGHWAENSINNLYNNRIVFGKSDTEFNPDGLTTRAELAAVLVRSLGLKASERNSFVDVSRDDWFFNDVVAAKEAGIISGVDDIHFNPNELVTREQAATIYLKVLEIAKYKVEVTDASNLANFQDKANISDWASKGISGCVSAGLLDGRENNLVVPQGNLTRAESVKMLEKALEKLNKL